jgi:hypothetical protein
VVGDNLTSAATANIRNAIQNGLNYLGIWRRGMDFKTAVDMDNAYAATLLRAALNRELLPHY